MRIPLKVYGPKNKDKANKSTRQTKQLEKQQNARRRKDKKNPSKAIPVKELPSPAHSGSKGLPSQVQSSETKPVPPPAPLPSCETQVEVQRLEVVCDALRSPLNGNMHVIIAFLQNKKVCGLTDLSQSLKTQVDVRESIPEKMELDSASSTERLLALWNREIVNNAEFYVRRRPFTFERQLAASDSPGGHLELLIGVVNVKDEEETTFPVLAVGRAALHFPTSSLFRGLVEADVELIGDFGKHRLFRIPNPKHNDISPETLTAGRTGDIDHFSNLLQPYDSSHDGEIQRCYLFRTAKVHLRVDSCDKENSTVLTPEDQQELQTGYFLEKKKSFQLGGPKPRQSPADSARRYNDTINSALQRPSSWKRVTSCVTADGQASDERKPFSTFKQGPVPKNVSSSVAGIASPFDVTKPRKKLPRKALIRKRESEKSSSVADSTTRHDQPLDQEQGPNSNDVDVDAHPAKDENDKTLHSPKETDLPSKNDNEGETPSPKESSILSPKRNGALSPKRKRFFSPQRSRILSPKQRQEDRTKLLQKSQSASSKRLLQEEDQSVQSLPAGGKAQSVKAAAPSIGIPASFSGELGKKARKTRMKASPHRRSGRTSPVKHRTLNRSLSGPLARKVEESIQEATEAATCGVEADDLQRETTPQTMTSLSWCTESESLLSEKSRLGCSASEQASVLSPGRSRRQHEPDVSSLRKPEEMKQQNRQEPREDEGQPWRESIIPAFSYGGVPDSETRTVNSHSISPFEQFGSLSDLFLSRFSLCGPSGDNDAITDDVLVPTATFERLAVGFETILGSGDEEDDNDMFDPYRNSRSSDESSRRGANGRFASETLKNGIYDQSKSRQHPNAAAENLDLVDQDGSYIGCKLPFILKA